MLGFLQNWDAPNISLEELEQKIDAGEEVVDRYFDAESTRIGTPRQLVNRRQKMVKIDIEIPFDLPELFKE